MFFEIKDLHAKIDQKPILKGVSLQVKPGEIHAIMGPNGAGKSTLSKVISGHPSYEITAGDILLNGNSILELEPDERALLGIFMSFQYPTEIQGVTFFQFLFEAFKARQDLDEESFREMILSKMAEISISSDFLDRDVNSGFSGGEKKRAEILQMQCFNPLVAILDETDSGLDIDAMKIVADGVNRFMGVDKGLILITHYQRLLDYIKPDFVHVMIDGKIVKSGDASLALELEKEGYNTSCLQS